MPTSVVQRARAALVAAVSTYVVRIDFHGNDVWVHQGTVRSVSPDGTDEDVVTTHDGKLTATTVDYTSRTWSSSTIPLSSPTAGGVPSNPCNSIGFNLLQFADPVALQHWLASEQFVRAPGTQNVDGQTTVELLSSCGTKPVFAIYLNADTLLPVEMTPNVGDTDPKTVLATFSILPATPSNLAHLKLQLPTGFTQVSAAG